MTISRLLLCVILVIISLSQSAHVVQKRSFVDVGCMGTFNREKFAKLHYVCDQCFEMYGEPDLHVRCRGNCFKNKYFFKCVENLLLSDEKDELESDVNLLYG